MLFFLSFRFHRTLPRVEWGYPRALSGSRAAAPANTPRACRAQYCSALPPAGKCSRCAAGPPEALHPAEIARAFCGRKRADRPRIAPCSDSSAKPAGPLPEPERNKSHGADDRKEPSEPSRHLPRLLPHQVSNSLRFEYSTASRRFGAGGTKCRFLRHEMQNAAGKPPRLMIECY